MRHVKTSPARGPRPHANSSCSRALGSVQYVPVDDEDDGVKRLTIENLLEPDEICLKLGDVPTLAGQIPASSGGGWAERFLAVRLAASAPVEIREMWSVAQGVL